MMTLFCWSAPVSGVCGSLEDLARMREAGVSDKVILAVAQEKAIETGLVTVEQIARLKRSGVSDGTIVAWVEQQSFLRDRGEKEYGFSLPRTRPLDVEEVLKLKEAGVNEELLQALVLGISGSAEGEAQRRAWDMLDRMEIILDKR